MSSSAEAELSVIADHLERYRERVVGLVPTLRGEGEHDDAIAAIYEAERGLSTAIRLLQRATRTAR